MERKKIDENAELRREVRQMKSEIKALKTWIHHLVINKDI